MHQFKMKMITGKGVLLFFLVSFASAEVCLNRSERRRDEKNTASLVARDIFAQRRVERESRMVNIRGRIGSERLVNNRRIVDSDSRPSNFPTGTTQREDFSFRNKNTVQTSTYERNIETDRRHNAIRDRRMPSELRMTQGGIPLYKEDSLRQSGRIYVHSRVLERAMPKTGSGSERLANDQIREERVEPGRRQSNVRRKIEQHHQLAGDNRINNQERRDLEKPETHSRDVHERNNAVSRVQNDDPIHRQTRDQRTLIDTPRERRKTVLRAVEQRNVASRREDERNAREDRNVDRREQRNLHVPTTMQRETRNRDILRQNLAPIRRVLARVERYASLGADQLHERRIRQREERRKVFATANREQSNNRRGERARITATEERVDSNSYRREQTRQHTRDEHNLHGKRETRAGEFENRDQRVRRVHRDDTRRTSEGDRRPDRSNAQLNEFSRALEIGNREPRSGLIQKSVRQEKTSRAIHDTNRNERNARVQRTREEREITSSEERSNAIVSNKRTGNIENNSHRRSLRIHPEFRTDQDQSIRRVTQTEEQIFENAKNERRTAVRAPAGFSRASEHTDSLTSRRENNRQIAHSQTQRARRVLDATNNIQRGGEFPMNRVTERRELLDKEVKRQTRDAQRVNRREQSGQREVRNRVFEPNSKLTLIRDRANVHAERDQINAEIRDGLGKISAQRRTATDARRRSLLVQSTANSVDENNNRLYRSYLNQHDRFDVVWSKLLTTVVGILIIGQFLHSKMDSKGFGLVKNLFVATKEKVY